MKKKADLVDRFEAKIYKLVTIMLDTTIAHFIRYKPREETIILNLIGIKQALNLDHETF